MSTKASMARKPRLTKKGATDALFIIGSDGNSIPSVDRLDQIETALRRSDSLNNALRGELIELITYVAFQQKSYRSRPAAH